MLVRRISKIIFNKRAMNNTVSATILTGAVITLSMVVFGWAQTRSAVYNREFGETVDAETARLKEKLDFEYIFYDRTSNNVTVFLLNSGTIDGIKIQTVYICDSSNTVIQIFSNPLLYSFKSWDEISGLDKGEEGRLVLNPEPPTSLLEDTYYCVKVVTVRGATFESGFVA